MLVSGSFDFPHAGVQGFVVRVFEGVLDAFGTVPVDFSDGLAFVDFEAGVVIADKLFFAADGLFLHDEAIDFPFEEVDGFFCLQLVGV